MLSPWQVNPIPVLMKVQNAIMLLLPARVVAQSDMGKQRMLAVLRAVGQTDFRAELAQISAPTLVLCGAKDRPNIPAAKELAAGITGAELQLVPGAGHEWNVQQAEKFSTRLNAFYLRLES